MDSPPRLWLVDDDPEMGVIVSLHCRRGGVALSSYGDVPSAWRAWQVSGAPPGLVLLDINLPGESGLTLLRRWRQAGGGPPVALFCQGGLSRDIAAGWAEGADYLLRKDLVADPDNWSRRLDEIFAHAGSGCAASALEWMVEGGRVRGASWGKLLARATEHAELRALGGVVLSQVVRRCLVTAFGPAAGDCLHPVSGRVSALALARPATLAQARAALVSLVDQVERLLGRAAGQRCEQRLFEAWTASIS